MKIAVAGGTGVVGSVLVDQLAAAGHEPVVLARGAGVDLLTGDGLAGRLDGVDAVVDVTSIATTRGGPATEFFTRTTGTLLDAGRAAGVRHHVLLSIVGIDVTPFGYYVGKVAQERLVEDAPVPSTIIRATQFHEFADQMIDRSGFGPVVFAPVMQAAPIAAGEVAALLAGIATGAPQGRAGDVRGPEELSVPEMTRRLLRRRGSRRLVVPAPLPGKAGRAMRGGALIPDDPGTVGTQTFDQWLAEQS
ncbi:3-beta hydroxysteroid dehydrogenase [Nocardioides marmoriginsengisoli]|uniref:3-beta hydroxysteroid dehydrogenase n=1 Tax=Nocardioides marmoriginsengisoli TaxID=661483 RepID=A0A3N0CCC5_9ACTN|nr:NAD(P)H-binding protein [Nocardioides marmoriginsengisoli]RNL61094.1 3-beta hydroxysteroid dehydrogenase [Nocardioides marmoriginsengisoli]